MVFRVQLSKKVVSQSLGCFVDGRPDNYLHDIALPGRVHLHPGMRATTAPARGRLGPRTTMAVIPEHGPGIHMGRDTSSTTPWNVAMRWGHRGWWVNYPGVSTKHPLGAISVPGGYRSPESPP